MGKAFSVFCNDNQVSTVSESVTFRPKPAKILSETEINCIQSKWLFHATDSEHASANGGVTTPLGFKQSSKMN
jgi:hypothetical protein